VIFDEKKLEVLRKFHWTILGGRFNQLSHVSSSLLRKPGEYYFGSIGIHGSIHLMKNWGRTFGWHLEDLHVTWAHLEKKRTRLRLYTKIHEEKHSECGDGVSNNKRRHLDYNETASEKSRRHQNLYG
ncbi:hypothetical protein Tco_0359787, partial [Tanacetum coccineum]